ncbi:TIGR01777 family oxidoreductase [Peredibacter sp. HCB2-198]|uniref:TIGR01777 family oxidoreductase n=1 Tax=Peredibacter sp. HCB2-198 TaxID=3383025 RepID=UPI0038B54405
MRVLVTGASGFVGQRVVKELLKNKHEVVVLTRNIAKSALNLGSRCKFVQWDAVSVPSQQAFEGVEAVINLMGEGLADKRWDDAQKRRIHDSRINGTHLLIKAIADMPKKPKVLVSASAVGIYGNRDAEEITETSTTGSDFLANLCKEWEAEAFKAKDLGLRVVVVRTGVVLGRGGGALKKMLPVFKLGAGGPIGNGKQFMSWIHVDDLASIYVEAVTNPTLQGAVNGTAPYPATNKEFTKALGKALHRPALMPVPAFALKAAFGEMSSVLLEGQRVLPKKIKEQKFRFHYPTLEMALKETAY